MAYVRDVSCAVLELSGSFSNKISKKIQQSHPNYFYQKKNF